MSELKAITEERIEQSTAAIRDKLALRIGALAIDYEDQGVFHSSMHVGAIIEECNKGYKESAEAIFKNLLWWLEQSGYVSETKAKQIVSVGLDGLDSIDSDIAIYKAKAEDIMPGSGMTHPMIASIASAREEAETMVRLDVRQWRAEHQRNWLKSIYSFLIAWSRRLLGFG